MFRLLLSLLLVTCVSCTTTNIGQDTSKTKAKGTVSPESLKTVEFQESDQDIPNPERGFTSTIDNLLTFRSRDGLRGTFRDGIRVLHTTVRLDPYRNSNLPPSVARNLNANLNVLRKAGIKAILRFQYNYPMTDNAPGPDAPLNRVLSHIEALTPVLERNKDVIMAVEAGFIGPFGNWSSSTNNLLSDANKDQIRVALMNAIPSGRVVQFPHVYDVMKWFPEPTGVAPEKFGTDKRFGVHNECFLTGPTDGRTFSSADPLSAERQYLKNLTANAGLGGQTCNPTGKRIKLRNKCEDILQEGADYHLTTLNRESYVEGFHLRWRYRGCLDEVKKKMGYRVVIDRVSAPEHATPETTLPVTIDLRNVGWAAGFNSRPMVITLAPQGPGEEIVFEVKDFDLRKFGPGKGTFTAEIPLTAQTNSYEIQISFPDPLLRDDPRFSVRPANLDDPAKKQFWDATTGRFRTGFIVQVKDAVALAQH